ncbi:unnamed protein product [Adineta steineri]|uniref:F-box domain-containing protein n=1 Tax=Adineta steineri TaxID=433720 RepID=A0A819YAT7_9BILA|nr:unnamed protein product [Adineta steineri]
MTTTILEDLSIELFYEIFTYFQLHEVFNSFSNLNSRFAAIINNMPLMPVYLGSNITNISLTEFYHIHLSQSNVCHRFISLCVSDEFLSDNGLWLSKHLSTFINLRHLSLIDIERPIFESILNKCLLNTSLIMFSIRFTTQCRAAYTYAGVPEGAYYERIFHLFPFLHICHLQYWRYIYSTLDKQILLPLNQVFITVKTSLFNLQSIVIRECSPVFLLHLLEDLPQLQDLSFVLSALWLPDKHPLKNFINNRVSNINKHLVPNLRRLKITLNNDIRDVESIDQLFDHDVLFSLTNFTLVGIVTGSRVVRNLLSVLSDQCSYTLMVHWRQCYTIAVLTIPQAKKTSYANEYLGENVVWAQSRYSKLVTGEETVQRDPYEYRIITRNLYGYNKTTKKSPPPINAAELNKYGREGWELCGIINGNYVRDLHLLQMPDAQLIFKRLKPKARIQSN